MDGIVRGISTTLFVFNNNPAGEITFTDAVLHRSRLSIWMGKLFVFDLNLFVVITQISHGIMVVPHVSPNYIYIRVKRAQLLKINIVTATIFGY